jgi:hypothetical protein
MRSTGPAAASHTASAPHALQGVLAHSPACAPCRQRVLSQQLCAGEAKVCRAARSGWAAGRSAELLQVHKGSSLLHVHHAEGAVYHARPGMRCNSPAPARRLWAVHTLATSCLPRYMPARRACTLARRQMCAQASL